MSKNNIWCLFSIENEYNQPNNNLVAWWTEKPSFESLAEAVGIEFEGEKNILHIVFMHQGQERMIDDTEYRLQMVSEGIL